LKPDKLDYQQKEKMTNTPISHIHQSDIQYAAEVV
jgi:hypothetical protein